jgi:hypothetical protein
MVKQMVALSHKVQSDQQYKMSRYYLKYMRSISKKKWKMPDLMYDSIYMTYGKPKLQEH